jgi:hypothetical protein
MQKMDVIKNTKQYVATILKFDDDIGRHLKETALDYCNAFCHKTYIKPPNKIYSYSITILTSVQINDHEK